MNSDNELLSHNTKRVAKLVEDKYQLDLLRYIDSPEHMETIKEHYKSKYEFLKEQSGNNNLLHVSENATKIYLISEAARMILREIAPKRPKKRKVKK